MAGIVSLIGEEVLGKNGMEKTVDVCKGKKVIGLYFSAHWCPPCRGFTPVLAEFYKKFKDDIQIIFVSSDKDEESYSDYYGEMPWVAVPFSAPDTKAKLGQQFNVSGIPTLIILKENGDVVTASGRNSVASSPDAFPQEWS